MKWFTLSFRVLRTTDRKQPQDLSAEGWKPSALAAEQSRPVEHGPTKKEYWARQIIQQCAAAGVRVFVKQLGAHPVSDRGNEDLGRWRTQSRKDPKAGNWDWWPCDLRVREFPDVKALDRASLSPTSARAK